WLSWIPQLRGWRFYFVTLVFAFLPVPFAIIRLSVVRNPPKTVPYAVAVFLGRLPRYLLSVALWPAVGLTSRSAQLLFWTCVIAAAFKPVHSAWRQAQRRMARCGLVRFSSSEFTFFCGGTSARCLCRNSSHARYFGSFRRCWICRP